MEIIYSGPHPAVEVSVPTATGTTTVTVTRGQPVDMPKLVAESLLQQDDWSAATKTATKSESKED